jgi:ASC-1-like (ASCH) protein
MSTVEKKAWPEYFRLVKAGKKKLEIRLADFGLKNGDTLILNEWSPKTKKYSGRKLKFRVGNLVKIPDMAKFYSKNEMKKYGFYIIELKK